MMLRLLMVLMMLWEEGSLVEEGNAWAGMGRGFILECLRLSGSFGMRVPALSMRTSLAD
jgi:hypothetical protein